MEGQVTASVVGGSCEGSRLGVSRSYGVRLLTRPLVTVLAIAMTVLALMPRLGTAFADEGTDGAPSSGSGSTSQLSVTESITDTENLLGGKVSSVSDAIASTRRDTGVSVRLLYLSTFGDNADPSRWAERLLNATQPPANTVLLAVASGDGKLVVAVSRNSEEWLRSQETVDRLSDAALAPIVDGDEPDWSGSAISMMNRLVTIERTSTSQGTVIVSLAVFGGVALILVAATVSVMVLRRRRARHPRRRRPGLRHASH